MKQFVKQPDLNAPRYRKRPYYINKTELYKKFIEKHPEYKHISYEQFRDMIYDFNTSLWKSAIKERDGVELPENLGRIFIGTCRPSTQRGNINPRLSSEYGQKLHNTNMGTDSKVGKIFYTNYLEKYRFKNRKIWSFTAHRLFKRETSEEYKNNWQKYIVIEPYMKVNNMYRRYKNKEIAQYKTKEEIQNYNEFDFDD